ncbi:hypothetical protein EDC65_5239 [Stella humosa]|uniref:Outer membrane lipoprotein-sorting protein n=1 Tax=Stella humosa TaxID=94 RepID=A0A3N1KKN3_9PROT|nr:hypothetical protein [Stella humosa]ROP81381.1 hypothetical protein EDC65_5239 [Stella humosa]BBK32732.1 hypothetical protein STHU_33660 [Stella humosa]
MLARTILARLCALLLLALGLPAAAEAQGYGPFGPPTAAYTADATLQLGRRSYDMRVTGQGLLERREMVTDGLRRIVLIDQGARRATLLMPDQRVAMDADIALVPGVGELLSLHWTARPLAVETVNGVRARKHQVDGTNDRGDRITGVAWVTGDNIMVRADLDVRRQGKRTRVVQELRNLRVGNVDRAQLTVPAGFRRMPLPMNLFNRRQ